MKTKILILLLLNLFPNAYAADSQVMLKDSIVDLLQSTGPQQSGVAIDITVLGRAKKLDHNGNDVIFSFISEPDAQKLFKELAAMTDVPFRFPEDGCYARAHAMSLLMDKKKITSAKFFLEGDLQVRTPYAQGGKVSWWYHVTPVVGVKIAGIIKVYALDPSIFDRAVPLHEWKQIQMKHRAGREDDSYFTRRFAYTPNDKWKTLNDYRTEDLISVKETLQSYLEIVQSRHAKN